MPEFFLGRQPIFDSELNVRAYELLYRKGATANFSGTSEDHATSDVLLNSFLEMGLDTLVGQHQAFVNLTRRFIVEQNLLPPPTQKLVLEILEHVDIDEELIGAVQALKDRGYIVALDDFVLNDASLPLVPHADIIKIDLRAMQQDDIVEHMRVYRNYPVKLLAEKVETPDEFEWCKSAGFDYFQGFFLCRPKVISGNRLPANRVNTMRMLSELQRPDTEVRDMEKIIAEDVTMSYRLLRYINSAAFSLRRKIESIRHAIVYLGLKEVRLWANMIAMSLIDDKPTELMMTSLVRAKMCELFADNTGQGNPGTAFLVGMFSLLDAMMDKSMEDLTSTLPLSDDITRALTSRDGMYGAMLHNAIAYERAEWDQIECPELSESEISDMYIEALSWANKTMTAMKAA